MRPYSLSRINCFKSCPMKYKMTYMDKLKQESSPALEKGSSIHESLEHLDYSNSYVNNFFNSELGKKYKDIIENAKKEVKIGLDIKEGKLVPCDFSEKCLYRGVIDVLYKNYILDYKSGNYHEKQDWHQLAYYALWLFLNSDYEEINISYLYIEHNKENSMTLKRSQINYIMKNLVSDIIIVENYESDPKEIYKTSYLCDFCGVRSHCKKNPDNLLKLNSLYNSNQKY